MITLPERQASLPIGVIPSEELIKELRSKAPLIVERHGSATMLVPVNVVDPYSKQRIWYQEEPRDSAP